jgi:hypothetical protein
MLSAWKIIPDGVIIKRALDNGGVDEVIRRVT